MDGLGAHLDSGGEGLNRDPMVRKVLAEVHDGHIHRNGEPRQAETFTSLVLASEGPNQRLLQMPNRIRELREARGLTLERAADTIGTSVQQLSRLERAERRLTDDWMRRIAPALGVRPSDLLSDTAPDTGEFVQQPDEVSLLRFWRLLTMEEKRMIAAFARDKGLEILGNNKPKKRSA